MKRLIGGFAGVVLVLMASWAMAGEKEAAALLAALQAKYPSTTFDSVSPSPVEGLFEVVTMTPEKRKQLAYADAQGRYMVIGRILDMQGQRDMTAERLASLNKITWSALPFDNAIKVVKGTGTRELAVFTDPDCPYCRRLEGELAKLDDYTAYIFLFPIAQLHPDARGKAEAVWCSNDPAKAWAALMLSGKNPPRKACNAPIDANIRLATSLGIQGTPFMIRKDGGSLPGAAPSERINAWLDGK